MIIDFSVQNFRSINDVQTLNFRTTGLKSAEKHSYIDKNNIFKESGVSLFKTIGIYGANASGKSNLIKALDSFIKVISAQPSDLSNLSSLCQPFLFQKEPEKTESFFQITLLIGGVKYRYGLTVMKNPKAQTEVGKGSLEIVTNEWLYADKNKKMSLLFLRIGDKIDKNNLQNKSKIPSSLPYKHSLFLTHTAAFDRGGDSNKISRYLRGLATSNFDVHNDKFRWLSISHINQDLDEKKKFINLLSSFNLKYTDVILEQDSIEKFSLSEIFPQDKIFLAKEFKLGNENISVTLNLKNNESAGTQKMFDLTGLLLRAFFTVKESAFIILDEIDSNFHPSLLIKLIRMFNDPEINKCNSQLLFTSHDTNLMSPSIMRRDQFYFTEKREDESTRLYSLSDLKGIRNDADFAKQYLAGFYGATPLLDNYCSQIDAKDE